MEVPLPGTNHFRPEGFDHVYQTRSEHILFCPGTQHPAALPQTPIQRALFTEEGLQQGRQASRWPGRDCVGSRVNVWGHFLQRVDAHLFTSCRERGKWWIKCEERDGRKFVMLLNQKLGDQTKKLPRMETGVKGIVLASLIRLFLSTAVKHTNTTQ